MSPTIKKLITIFFLVVFSLGNMPRQFFHETLASHRDTVTDCNHAQKAMGCIHQVNFNCHYDNLVVNTVYVANLPDTPVPAVTINNDYSGFLLLSQNSPCPDNRDSRGPPFMS